MLTLRAPFLSGQSPEAPVAHVSNAFGLLIVYLQNNDIELVADPHGFSTKDGILIEKIKWCLLSLFQNTFCIIFCIIQMWTFQSIVPQLELKKFCGTSLYLKLNFNLAKTLFINVSSPT